MDKSAHNSEMERRISTGGSLTKNKSTKTSQEVGTIAPVSKSAPPTEKTK